MQREFCCTLTAHRLAVFAAVAVCDARLLHRDERGGGIGGPHTLVGGTAALLIALRQILSVGVVGSPSVLPGEQQDLERRCRTFIIVGDRKCHAEDDDAVEERGEEARGGKPVL